MQDEGERRRERDTDRVGTAVLTSGWESGGVGIRKPLGDGGIRGKMYKK